MEDYLAGIDLGSTTLKAVIYDTGGNVVASACRPTEQAPPRPETSRVDGLAAGPDLGRRCGSHARGRRPAA